MELTAERIHQAYIQSESFGNQILYEMCQRYPGQDNPDVIEGKIWLIGRTYAAALERKRPPEIETPKLYQLVCERLAESDLDARIQQLRMLETVASTNLEGIAAVLETHWLFVKIVEEFTLNRRISLASKYLHFHLPNLFFIYDSIVWWQLAAIKKQEKLSLKGRFKTLSGNYDDNYKIFFLSMLLLRDHLCEKFEGQCLTPRQLDRLLWGY